MEPEGIPELFRHEVRSGEQEPLSREFGLRRAASCRSTAGGIVLLLALFGAAALRAEEWYDAYDRGMQASRAQEWGQAIECFQRAIKKRPEPGDNLLTYGTNRIEHYHPYLRLAEAQLRAGNPKEAEAALAESERFGKEPADGRARLRSSILAATPKSSLPSAAAAPPSSAPPSSPPAPEPRQEPQKSPSAPPAGQPSPQPANSAHPEVAAFGTLDVVSTPPGATVLVGGRLIGSTPVSVDLPPGTYTVVLRMENMKDTTFPVKIVAGQRATPRPTLVPLAPAPQQPAPAEIPQRISITITSRPPGAAIYLDDVPVGTTDALTGRLTIPGAQPGSHRLRFVLAGHAEQALMVEVKPGGPASFSAEMAPLRQREAPWFTLAIGSLLLVSIAGIALAVIVRRRRELAETHLITPKGPIPPRTPSGTKRVIGDPSDGSPGAQFGEYRIIELIGKGGMAAVYKAERQGEIVALKRPLPALLEEQEFLRRFLREAEIGRTLHHPNIIRIFEQGEVGNVPYFTMELIEGETLRSFAERTGPLEPRLAAEIIAQAGEALDYAHLKGVVHRDLKPSNIMLRVDGVVKVMDYGIARARRFQGLTITGSFLGTPDYLSPETADGRGSDGRSDLYSLGVIFYEILTGQHLFVADTPLALLRKHCDEAPTPPTRVRADCPAPLEAIVLKLLSKKPEDRYQTAEELLVELRGFLAQAPA